MKFLIDENDENIRLDAQLANLINDISRSKIQSAIKNGKVLINGEVKKPSHKLHEGDFIEFDPQETNEVEIPAQNIPLDIIYEDENMLVVNKPSGMLTHPTTIERENTLVTALLYKYGNNFFKELVP